MADSTNVVRFPNRKRLHLVWSLPAPEDAAGRVPEPKSARRLPVDTMNSAPRSPGDGTTAPRKPD